MNFSASSPFSDWLRPALVAAMFATATVQPAAAASGQVSKYYPPQPLPAPALSAFESVAGGWACHGRMEKGALIPGTPATDYTSTLVFEPLHQGHSYKISYELRFPDDPMVFTGTWYVSWDAVIQKLSYVWFDNMGSIAHETSQGWQGDRLELNGEASPPPSPGGAGSSLSNAKVRDVLTRTGPDRLHWKGGIQVSGTNSWITLADDDCVRSWPKP